MFQNIYRGRRVLVTGHTGFKGSWLTKWLLNLGADVCGYSIDIPTTPSNFETLELKRHIEHHLGDVRDYRGLLDVFQKFKPEIVFHMAAQPLVRASYDDPKGTFDTNIGGTVNVLECIRKTGSVQASVLVATDKCYENVETQSGYQETDRLGGKDPYSASKACGEIVFSAYQRSFFSNQDRVRVASARAGNVIGGGDWAIDRVVPDCVRAWSKKEQVQIRNPQSTRPWQHVLEPLGGYLLLAAQTWLANPDVVGQSFNFGPLDDSSRTVSQLLSEMQSHWKNGCWVEAGDPAELKKEAKLLRLNCDKARNLLNWRAVLSFEESVEMTMSWYHAYYTGREMKEMTDLHIKLYQDIYTSRIRVRPSASSADKSVTPTL